MTTYYHSFNRFRDHYISDDDSKYEYWSLPDYPSFPAQSDDVWHEVVSYDRLDMLAQRYYKDPMLKWVIASANGIDLEPTDLKQGERLLIPSPRYVLQILFQTKANF